MTTPEVICCPDGHFHQAIYGLGPYITDYLEQVWLAGIVQNWCLKYVPSQSVNSTMLIINLRCNAPPDNLDGPNPCRQSHDKTDFLIKCFHPDVLWSEFGICSDVVVCKKKMFDYYSHSHLILLLQPFTHGFTHADIHELLLPDLLHQFIKGTFKDHYVTWVNEYLFIMHSETQALEIIQDIDHW